MCHALTLKELERFKLSPSTKSATIDKFITKKHKEAVSNIELTVTILNQKYPASTTHILQKFSNFYCKIEIFVAFYTYFASNITLVLRFMISNKFYYVQTAKVNSEDVIC